MLYIVNNKPYIRVANYLKEVSISKNKINDKEYDVKPVSGENTKIEYSINDNMLYAQMSVEDFYKKKNQKKIATSIVEELD